MLPSTEKTHTRLKDIYIDKKSYTVLKINKTETSQVGAISQVQKAQFLQYP